MGRGAVSMLECFPVALAVGTALGFLSGLGTGGGSLLILWLTMVLHMDAAMARSINLLFYLPAAAVACLFRWKQGKLDWKSVLPAILAGCAAAGIFSYWVNNLDLPLLQKLFGGLLIFIGLRELFYRRRKAR